MTLSQLDSLRRELIVSSRLGYRHVIFGKVRCVTLWRDIALKP